MLKTISALKNAMLVTAKFTEIFYSCGHSHFIKLSMKEKKNILKNIAVVRRTCQPSSNLRI